MITNILYWSDFAPQRRPPARPARSAAHRGPYSIQRSNQSIVYVLQFNAITLIWICILYHVISHYGSCYVINMTMHVISYHMQNPPRVQSKRPSQGVLRRAASRLIISVTAITNTTIVIIVAVVIVVVCILSITNISIIIIIIVILVCVISSY